MAYRDGHAAALERNDALERELKALGVDTSAKIEADSTDVNTVNREFAEMLVRTVISQPGNWTLREGFWTLKTGVDNREDVNLLILVIEIRTSFWCDSKVVVKEGFTRPANWEDVGIFGGRQPVVLKYSAAKMVICALETLPTRHAKLKLENKGE